MDVETFTKFITDGVNSSSNNDVDVFVVDDDHDDNDGKDRVIGFRYN